MDISRHDFLARAGFAGNQDRCFGSGDLIGELHHFRHLRILEDERVAFLGDRGENGGDEFCVLLRDEADEARCAAALQSLLAERRKEITLLPTLSLGSAVFSGEDVVTVKDRADRALYCAKNELKARAAAAMPAGGSGEKD